MKPYIAHHFLSKERYLSSKVFRSQGELKDYLRTVDASYDAHKLSDLGEDSIIVNKLNLDGFIEIEELATPSRTDSVVIDGIEYISIDEASKRYNMSACNVRKTIKTKGLKTFTAGAMSRIFVESWS